MKAIWLFIILLVQAPLGLTEEEFHKSHRGLQPDPNATWRMIPWKVSVPDAQATAVGKREPIFIWAMDGHPLGCT